MSEIFTKIAYLFNAGSTNHRRSKKLLGDIKKFYPNAKLTELELLKDGPEKSRMDIIKLAKNFNTKTLVVLGGGDGTVNFVIETILSSGELSKNNKNAVFLPVWGGNANDLSVMLNGSIKNKATVNKILNHAEVAKIYPLKVTINEPLRNETISRLAINYASFGITARAISVIEKSSKNITVKIFSNMPFRLIPETIDFFKAFIEAQPFVVQSEDKSESIYERVFINGSRIAKIEHFPASLLKKQYYVASSTKRRFGLDFAKAILRPDMKNMRSSSTEFTVNDDIIGQIDGETIAVLSGNKISVGINQTPFRAVTTKFEK